MEDRGSGTIVNITSLATLFPLPYMPIYNAGKSALSSFTQSMELESRTVKWIDFRLGDVRQILINLHRDKLLKFKLNR